MATPTVSVIIPAYNGQRWLPEAAQSVLSQTYPDLELIIVDDGSTDGTRKVIEAFLRNDPRVRAIYKTVNGDGASARNAGIAAARGKYVSLLDQDDLMEPTKLERQVAFLEQHPEATLVYGHYLVMDNDGRTLDKQPVQPHTAFQDLWESCRCLHLGAALIRKRVLDAVGPFNEKVGWATDFELVLKIARRGGIAFQDGVALSYRWHGENTCAKDDREFYRYTLEAIQSIGPVPEEGVTVLELRRRTARLHYCLARLEREQGAFADATRHFWKAVVSCPSVGMLFQEHLHTASQSALQIIKPYGALLQSAVLATLHRGPRRHDAHRN